MVINLGAKIDNSRTPSIQKAFLAHFFLNFNSNYAIATVIKLRTLFALQK